MIIKMNLSQILALVDTNKPTYDARRRDGKLLFMDDFAAYGSNNPAVHEHEVKRNRYGIGHAVGLAVFNALVAKGLTTADAEYVVGNQFSAMLVADQEGLLNLDDADIMAVDPYHMGVIYFSNVRKMHIGGPSMRCLAYFNDAILEGKAALSNGEERGAQCSIPTEFVLVNVTEIYRQVRIRLLSGLGV